jgi:hypothetical protein
MHSDPASKYLPKRRSKPASKFPSFGQLMKEPPSQGYVDLLTVKWTYMDHFASDYLYITPHPTEIWPIPSS